LPNHVELLCIGNELLIGKTLNTNAWWLAKRITALGLEVKRITVVGDNIEEIVKALKEALRRKPKILITTGGLGPTFDDKTLEGIARALNQKLEINQDAYKMIEEKYRSYVRDGKIDKFELTPYRIKMAKLPEKGKPLPNPIGTAPGILLKHGNTYIVALPGVPPEMEAIFNESVAPLVREKAKGVTFYEMSIHVNGIVESEIAPLIDKAMHDNPYVYIKSHPKSAKKKPHIEIHFSTTAKDANIAKKRISRTLIQISELIQAKGGKVKVPKKAI
jgi:molybdenum cofactor synthesis domain-containing protein